MGASAFLPVYSLIHYIFPDRCRATKSRGSEVSTGKGERRRSRAGNKLTIHYTYAGGIQPIEPGLSNWLELNLAPGNYVAVCFVPEISGISHVDEGMIKEITVQ